MNTTADNLLGRGALARRGWRLGAPCLLLTGSSQFGFLAGPPAFPLVPLPSSSPPVDEGLKLPICHLLQAATLLLPSPPALPPRGSLLVEIPGFGNASWGCVHLFLVSVCREGLRSAGTQKSLSSTTICKFRSLKLLALVPAT